MEQSFSLLVLTKEISSSHMIFIKKLQQFLMNIFTEKRIKKTTLCYSKIIESKNLQLTEFYTKFFYVYRLIFVHPVTSEKLYYYGYRSCKTGPLRDSKYWSSSDTVKKLIREFGSKCFKKKILGVYTFIIEALEVEIFLHKKFDVRNHPKFLNLANQTSTKFEFGSSAPRSKISNQKRSKTLQNRIISPKTREKISQSHLNRERSESETLNRQQAMIKTNSRFAVCPHCYREVGIPGGKRWHFENCLENPNISEAALLDRENVRNQQIERNRSRRKNKKQDP